MVSQNGGFTMLGMNLGKNAADYTLLHDQVQIKQEETVQSILQDYDPTSTDKTKQGEIKEKLFRCLLNRSSDFTFLEDAPMDIDKLANLLLNEGWDVLEFQLDNTVFKNLIENNVTSLLEKLCERIKDEYGAEQFKKTYPQLCSVIQSKLFHCFLSGKSDNIFPQGNSAHVHMLTELLLDKGLGEEPLKQLVEDHATLLLEKLNEKIKNKAEAEQFKKTYPQLYSLMEEKLYHCVLIGYSEDIFPQANPQHIDALTQLLVGKGWDVFESRVKEPVFTKLIEDSPMQLIAKLDSSIKDKKDAEVFKKTFPQLCSFLRNRYHSELPKHLKQNVLSRLVQSLKRALFQTPTSTIPSLPISPSHSPIHPSTPLDNRLQSIKDRLAVQFFKQVVSREDRPAVISLQEVFKENDGVLSLLKESDYIVVRSNGSINSDTAIAIDTTRFQPDIKMCDLGKNMPDATAVHAKELSSNEEYIFISLHISGYNLDYSKDMDPDQLKAYTNRVEADMEAGQSASLRKLTSGMDHLKEQYPNAHIIVQGDFNTYPEYFDLPVSDKIKKMNAFKLLENQNMNLVRSNLPTELYRPSSQLPKRELDYLMTSENLKGRVTIFSPEEQQESLVKLKGDVDKGMHFDPMLLFSDHRPIWSQVANKEDTN